MASVARPRQASRRGLRHARVAVHSARNVGMVRQSSTSRTMNDGQPPCGRLGAIAGGLDTLVPRHSTNRASIRSFLTTRPTESRYARSSPLDQHGLDTLVPHHSTNRVSIRSFLATRPTGRRTHGSTYDSPTALSKVADAACSDTSQVCSPTIPSTVTCPQPWNVSTADFVCAPKSPSTTRIGPPH